MEALLRAAALNVFMADRLLSRFESCNILDSISTMVGRKNLS